MPVFRKHLKNLLQQLTGSDIERYGEKCFALINRSRREDAWFSYDAQIRTLIEKQNIDLILDVGANEGQFAQKMRSFYPGDIHSFEPVSSAFDKLARIASSDRHWYVHNCALGSQESIRTINVANLTVFSSLLKPNDYCAERFGGQSLGMKEEAISVRRMDKLLDEILPGIASRRALLKMDTQGYDLEVFNGLGNALKHVVALQSEVSLVSIYEGMPHWLESISVYETRGFGVVGMFPISQDSNRVIEYDCLLVRCNT